MDEFKKLLMLAVFPDGESDPQGIGPFTELGQRAAKEIGMIAPNGVDETNEISVAFIISATCRRAVNSEARRLIAEYEARAKAYDQAKREAEKLPPTDLWAAWDKIATEFDEDTDVQCGAAVGALSRLIKE